tara:strand:- start:445 stop:1470 length:1026 start_codon:yes stop_codon:yes gene_type:complete
MTIKSTSNNIESLVVNSSTAKTLVSYLMSKGLNQADIEKELKFKLHFVENLDVSLPLPIYQSLWDLAIDHTHEPYLGLKLAQSPYNNEMGLVSHVFFNSLNLREGLKQYIRYYSLINESITVQLSANKGRAIVSYFCHNKNAYCSQDIEHTLALSVTRIKENISKEITLDEVHFEHSCHDLKHYENFFSCPVYFNQKQSSLIFKEKYLDYTFPKKSTHLFHFLTNHLEQLLSKLKKKESLSDQVRRIIEKSLSSGEFDAENIASELHMSRPTLYRKLKSEGFSFHEIVDKVRKDKAELLLSKNQHTLSEIAFLLGFSELSSFSRAFKKWTGSSPAKFIKGK